MHGGMHRAWKKPAWKCGRFGRESKCFSIENPCSIGVRRDWFHRRWTCSIRSYLLGEHERVFSRKENSRETLLRIAIAIPSAQDALVLLSDRRDYIRTYVCTYVETRRSFSIPGLPGNFFEGACGRWRGRWVHFSFHCSFSSPGLSSSLEREECEARLRGDCESADPRALVPETVARNAPREWKKRSELLRRLCARVVKITTLSWQYLRGYH